MSLVIYHNPRCTKSRQTLELLLSKGLNPQVIEYLKEPPSAVELKSVLKKLGPEAKNAIRTKEEAYLQLGLPPEGISEEAMIHAITRHPILLERPIVVNGDQAAIGRPRRMS